MARRRGHSAIADLLLAMPEVVAALGTLVPDLKAKTKLKADAERERREHFVRRASQRDSREKRSRRDLVTFWSRGEQLESAPRQAQTISLSLSSLSLSFSLSLSLSGAETEPLVLFLAKQQRRAARRAISALKLQLEIAGQNGPAHRPASRFPARPSRESVLRGGLFSLQLVSRTFWDECLFSRRRNNIHEPLETALRFACSSK